MQNNVVDGNQKAGQLTTSTIWTIATNIGDRVIGFASIAIMARLLSPEDFGLVALASSVIGLADILTALGLDWVLVRHPNPTKEHYNSAWTLRIILGVITSLILLALSPITAYFFKQQALKPVIATMVLTFLIGSFENIGVVAFRRNFLFNLEFILRLAPKIVGFVVGITFAFITRSYWALLLSSLAFRLTCTIMSYTMVEFKPRFTLIHVRELLSISIWLLLGNVVSFLRTCFVNFFVTHHFGTGINGMYSVSNQIAHISSTELVAPINLAAFSKYAQSINQLNVLREAFLTTASMTWMLAIPISIGTISISYEFIVLMLGQQWTGAVTILRLLIIGGVFFVMAANSQNVFLALGKSKVVAILALFALGIMVCFSILLTSYFGLVGIALGYIVTSFLMILISYYFLWRIVGIRFMQLWRRVWRTCVASCGMGILLNFLFKYVPLHSSLEAVWPLFLKVFSGIVIYTILLAGLWVISGCPEGPENAILNVVKRIWSGIFTKASAN